MAKEIEKITPPTIPSRNETEQILAHGSKDDKIKWVLQFFEYINDVTLGNTGQDDSIKESLIKGVIENTVSPLDPSNISRFSIHKPIYSPNCIKFMIPKPTSEEIANRIILFFHIPDDKKNKALHVLTSYEGNRPWTLFEINTENMQPIVDTQIVTRDSISSL